ncbi:hypothetical protein JX265_013378 [Neoarthrinium moseri]|uniref:Uncharacterized protein n=1 Tax=Neoarthrinium moseri TaxID=1658444 RepID=A0A9P9W8J4_9PEZI|nr:hypothetical protein JX265_013378 [Neoarthrinium moseri]
MHIDQDSVGEESDDDDRMSDDDSGPEEGLLAKLSGLYSEAGPILEEYLSKPDDPNKSAQQIMIEPYEPLDKFNERITQELGKKHGRGFTIKYTLLKTYSRDILQLKNDIEEADGPVKETLQNKFSVLVNKIRKYVRTNQLPDDWATLLGVEAPGPSFDIERDSSWDEPYLSLPRSKTSDMIFLSWVPASGMRPRRIFVMTPGGMECMGVRKLGLEGHSFIQNHPEQKRISGTDPFPNYTFIGVADVWADGSGTEMRFPAIYLLLRFHRPRFQGNVFRVAARSTTKRAQWFDDDETVVRMCQARGFQFNKTLKARDNTYRRNRTGQLNNDSLTLTGTQSANPTSTGDDRIQDLVSTVRQRDSIIAELQLQMQRIQEQMNRLTVTG